MFSNKAVNYFNAHKQFGTAPHNDTILPYRTGEKKLNGIVDEMARFIEKNQLLDADKWKLFVSQFKIRLDSDNEGWRGEYWGKMMRGACITYSYTKNPELYDILTKTVIDILDTQDSLGRISTYSADKEYRGWDIWCRKYVILGLLHFHEICSDDALKERIEGVLCAHLDYMVNTIGDDKTPINETSSFWGSANSVSLLEPVMRMYNLTGKQEYLEFADYIVKTGPKDINIFEEAYKNEMPPYKWSIVKAYELISCFEGLIEYYRSTGIEKWKTAAENFAKRLIDTEVSIVGCCGCRHELFSNGVATQTDPNYIHPLQETCVTVTWMKFCYQMLRLTGKVIYADEIEKSVYNALYGAVNTEKTELNGGLMFDSYSPLRFNIRGRDIGGVQYDENNKIIYGCCAAIGAAGTGLVPEIAAGITKQGIVFNLYVDGEYSLVTPSDDNLKISVNTLYPQDGAVKITVDPEKSQEFEIMLRIPEFSTKTTLSVNNNPISVVDRYVRINRRWEKGDIISLDIDMHTHVLHPIGCCDNPESLKYIAVKYGPIVLARDARICQDAGKTVELDFAADDSIKLERINNTEDFKVLCEFKVPCKNGGYIKMIDYQSAGKTWNKESALEAWMLIE